MINEYNMIRYCYPTLAGEPMGKNKTPDKSDLRWKYRVLCSDESCIGVIGPDKRCRECGRLYEGELPSYFEEYVFEDEKDKDDKEMPFEDTGVEGLDEDEENDDAEDAPIADDEWANRILCSDESCIGVIGSDGRCKDCGKPLDDLGSRKQ